MPSLRRRSSWSNFNFGDKYLGTYHRQYQRHGKPETCSEQPPLGPGCTGMGGVCLGGHHSQLRPVVTEPGDPAASESSSGSESVGTQTHCAGDGDGSPQPPQKRRAGATQGRFLMATGSGRAEGPRDRSAPASPAASS